MLTAPTTGTAASSVGAVLSRKWAAVSLQLRPSVSGFEPFSAFPDAHNVDIRSLLALFPKAGYL